jgi:hypothetical protein
MDFIKTVILPFFFILGVYYLIGSFIAWDFNPLHWWLFTSTFGRILGIIFVSFAFTAALKISDDL